MENKEYRVCRYLNGKMQSEDLFTTDKEAISNALALVSICQPSGFHLIRVTYNETTVLEISLNRKTQEELLFDTLQKYGTPKANFEMIDQLGFPFRVRVFEYQGRKYFTVQVKGRVKEVLEI